MEWFYMSTYTEVTNFEKNSPVFWPILYNVALWNHLCWSCSTLLIFRWLRSVNFCSVQETLFKLPSETIQCIYLQELIRLDIVLFTAFCLDFSTGDVSLFYRLDFSICYSVATYDVLDMLHVCLI